MTRWLLVIGLALFAAAAGAHKPSDSYLNLRVTENRIEGQWDIALRDLELAVGLDSNGDGEITWGEVRAQHEAIAEYAQKRLTIRNGSAVCPLRVLEHQVDEHSDGAYAVMRLAGECSQSITQLEIEYRLLFDRDAQHRGLLRLQSASGEVTAIFPIDKPVQRFTLGSASLFSQLLSFVADGVKHIAIGFDHILFLLALLLPAVMVRPDRQWLPQKDLRTTFWSVFSIVTAFTIAHSITLSLAALEVVQLPSRLVESLIAASVLLTAIDNVVPFLPRRRWL
ncbi:MAG: HupE/UreJ family protein, partial [Betaproteobacteria bacterium]|nr:HupE/UreJ family protein [Betaproteobacteria bacterium]